MARSLASHCEPGLRTIYTDPKTEFALTRPLPPLLLTLLLAAFCGLAMAGEPEAAPAAEPAPAESKTLTNATVTVGCGMCQLGKKDDKGCNWTVQLDDTPYTLEGPVPHDHDSHAPDGICKAKRKAVVDGELKGGKFVATRFELLPLEGTKGK